METPDLRSFVLRKPVQQIINMFRKIKVKIKKNILPTYYNNRFKVSISCFYNNI